MEMTNINLLDRNIKKKSWQIYHQNFHDISDIPILFIYMLICMNGE